MALNLWNISLFGWAFLTLKASGTLPIVSFDDGYTHLFGNDNLVVLGDGKSVHVSLDDRSGSGFVSQDLYLHGSFSALIKLPSDYTAGVVVAFYMSNGELFEKNHDEIDFEFLGNIRGHPWRLQTNVYGNGSTGVGREERYTLWFDPSEDFHKYSIVWTENQIIFYVDEVPIREISKTEAMVGDFPSKPMFVYATIWDGSGWATNGGRYKVNYKYSPFVAELSSFVLHGCAVNPVDYESECSGNSKPGALVTLITPGERTRMSSFRRKYVTYNYCYDRTRYPLPPGDCIFDQKEMEWLQRFDSVTFGSGRRRHGKHYRQRNVGKVHRV